MMQNLLAYLTELQKSSRPELKDYLKNLSLDEKCLLALVLQKKGAGPDDKLYLYDVFPGFWFGNAKDSYVLLQEVDREDLTDPIALCQKLFDQHLYDTKPQGFSKPSFITLAEPYEKKSFILQRHRESKSKTF